MTYALRDRTAIAGVGYSPLTARSGATTATLATVAILAALEDAGLSVADVDGLATYTYGNDSTPPNFLAPMLGLRDLRYYLDQTGGGSTSHSVVAAAAMAVATGVADCVVCYRALNARSGVRMGGTGATHAFAAGPELQHRAPVGYLAPVQEFALGARAHMQAYGTTSEQLGRISVSQRRNASMNERAMKRQPITLDDYLKSRWIAEPLRLLDCCLETDGACAVVVVSAERAKDLRQRPVLISGAAWGGGSTLFDNGTKGFTTTVVADHVAPRLYSAAGIGPSEVDVAELYDCFTYTVVLQLEDYGFCGKGEAGAFIDGGNIGINGSLPVNTHGGSLSEGYVHGLNHLAEAVQQLRGTCGPRQVPGAEIALSTGQPGFTSGYTSALMLRR